IGYGIVYSNLDNPRSPREGIRANLTQEWAGVGGDANFVKTDAGFAAYMPLSQDADIVGFGRVRGGHIQSLGSTYRVLDNYFQGSQAIRGFDSYGFGPRDPITGDALGGSTYFNATAEVQFPLPFLPQSVGLRGAVFADGGSLFGVDSTSKAAILASNPGEDMSSVTDSSIRASVGVSVIWDSPFGPIRFDYAEPLMSKPWDKKRRFNFGASTSF
ncbi:MAG: BamA/TamA family outer membrane protein, partial [Amylibacter sp.]